MGRKQNPTTVFQQGRKGNERSHPSRNKLRPQWKEGHCIVLPEAAGKFDAAVREWEAKPAASKTWANIKTFISAEYAKENKQNIHTAKRYKANVIQEQAEETEELIVALTKNHTCQMEGLITSTTNTMKEMMLLLKENKNPNPTNNQTSEEKKKKRDEKCQKYNDAPICKNCG